MSAMTEVTAIQHAVELWGPVGALVAAVLVGGWMALKWLANRDDARNAKTYELIDRVATIAEGFKTTVANNTAAMHEMKDASERMVLELGLMRDTILPAAPARSRPKSVRARA